MLSKEQIIEVESLPVDIQTGATYAIKYFPVSFVISYC